MKRASAFILSTLLLGACGSDVTPELTAQQLMAQRVQPTAEIYWDAVRYESVLENGEPVQRDIEPQTDADWKKVQDAAIELGKLGELLKTPGYTDGRGDDWTTFAQALVDVSKRAEAAAAAKDPAAVFEVGGTVYSVCTACHGVYPPAAGTGTEAAPGA